MNKKTLYMVALCFFPSVADCAAAVDVASSEDVSVEASTDSPDDTLPSRAGSVFFGGGIGVRLCESSGSLVASRHSTDAKCSAFMGSLIFGCGRSFTDHSIYVGGEFLMDFSKSSHSHANIDGQNVKVSNGGIVPSIGIRCGSGNISPGLMVFGKVGISRLSADVDCGLGNVSSSSFAPSFEVGLEKPVSSKYTIRLGVECLVGRDKSNGTVRVERGRSLNLRALIVHNVRTS
jgi:hypothetical protein